MDWLRWLQRCGIIISYAPVFTFSFFMKLVPCSWSAVRLCPHNLLSVRRRLSKLINVLSLMQMSDSITILAVHSLDIHNLFQWKSENTSAWPNRHHDKRTGTLAYLLVFFRSRTIEYFTTNKLYYEGKIVVVPSQPHPTRLLILAPNIHQISTS